VVDPAPTGVGRHVLVLVLQELLLHAVVLQGRDEPAAWRIRKAKARTRTGRRGGGGGGGRGGGGRNVPLGAVAFEATLAQGLEPMKNAATNPAAATTAAADTSYAALARGCGGQYDVYASDLGRLLSLPLQGWGARVVLTTSEPERQDRFVFAAATTTLLRHHT